MDPSSPRPRDPDVPVPSSSCFQEPAGPSTAQPAASPKAAAGSSAMAAMPPSKAQVRREKERRSLGNELTGRRKKKARMDELKLEPAAPPESSRHGAEYEEDIYDPQGSQPRNFSTVRYQRYIIETGYFSPYPISPAEDPALAASLFADMKLLTHGNGDAPSPAPATTLDASQDLGRGASIPGVVLGAKDAVSGSKQAGHVPKATLRAHGRTSDLFAGGLGTGEEGARGELFVCEGCFKYSKDFTTFEQHRRACDYTHPPGRKVYEHGSRAIWEVDGAQAGLYCQNLSLFGKLFIHTKTVFFSVEDFTYYVLTDSSSGKSHLVVGFFSKEKISYEGFNLNCIITFPPWQKLGHGRLMIEFSYVLTQRAPTPGTPERPLSDLGLQGYLGYWRWALVRALDGIFAEVPKAGKRGFESEGLRTTFDELGRRAHLRTDDVALALQDTPLVRLARDGAHARDEILLTREALDEFVASRRLSAPPLIDESCILL